MEQDDKPDVQSDTPDGAGSAPSPEEQREAFIEWAKAKLDGAARMLREKSVYAGLPVEARVSWTLPHQLLENSIHIRERCEGSK